MHTAQAKWQVACGLYIPKSRVGIESSVDPSGTEPLAERQPINLWVSTHSTPPIPTITTPSCNDTTRHAASSTATAFGYMGVDVMLQPSPAQAPRECDSQSCCRHFTVTQSTNGQASNRGYSGGDNAGTALCSLAHRPAEPHYNRSSTTPPQSTPKKVVGVPHAHQSAWNTTVLLPTQQHQPCGLVRGCQRG